MAENEQAQAATNTEAQAATAQQQTQAQTPTQDVEDVSALPGWAQKAISDLRKENASHRKAKTEAERTAAQAAETAAKEQGKWKELAEGYEPKAKRADALEAYIGEVLDAKLANLPDKLKALVPEGDALSRLKWVQAAEAAGILTAPGAATTDARDNSRAQDQAANAMSDQDAQEFAAVYGVNPKFVPRQRTR